MAASHTFPEKLKQFRAVQGMTQVQLAKESGMSHPQIARYEQGTSKPRMKAVLKLAHALGVEPRDLVGEKKDGAVGVHIGVYFDKGSMEVNSHVPNEQVEVLRSVADAIGWDRQAFHLAVAVLGSSDRNSFSVYELKTIYETMLLVRKL